MIPKHILFSDSSPFWDVQTGASRPVCFSVPVKSGDLIFFRRLFRTSFVRPFHQVDTTWQHPWPWKHDMNREHMHKFAQHALFYQEPPVPELIDSLWWSTPARDDVHGGDMDPERALPPYRGDE